MMRYSRPRRLSNMRKYDKRNREENKQQLNQTEHTNEINRKWKWKWVQSEQSYSRSLTLRECASGRWGLTVLVPCAPLHPHSARTATLIQMQAGIVVYNADSLAHVPHWLSLPLPLGRGRCHQHHHQNNNNISSSNGKTVSECGNERERERARG